MKLKYFNKDMLKVILYILIVYVIINLIIIWAIKEYLFQPPKSPNSLLPHEQLIDSKYGKVSLIDLPAPTAQYTVLYNHGNAEDLYRLYPLLKQIQSANYRVISYDYSGYRNSENQPNVRTIYNNVNTVYQYILKQKIKPEYLIILGHSLGSAPATYLAANKKSAALILLSPFSSVIRSQIGVNWPIFLGDIFNNAKLIQSVRVPVLIIVDPKDKVIKSSNSQYLYKLANLPKELVTMNLGSNGHDVSWREVNIALTLMTDSLSEKVQNIAKLNNP